MILDNPIIHDQRIKSLGMKFNSIVKQNKLVIQATCQGDNSQYTGKVAQNPDLSFDQIVQHLDERTFNIIQKNQDVLRLEIMSQEVEFYSMSKLQLNELKQTIRALTQRQNGFELMINGQTNQLNTFKDSTNQFKLGITNQIRETIIEQIQKIKIDQLKLEMIRITTEINEHFEQLKKHQNQIKATSNTMSRQSYQFKHNEVQQKYLISCLQSKLNCQLKFQSSWQISRLNEPIKSCKWSEQLKSKSITINNNVVALTKWTSYREFCLLNASFSNKLKTKQSWAVKINKKTDWIDLGVCLENKMINYNFNDQNIKWRETGHGLYMIDSDGFCYSHSKKEFNRVKNSFQFYEGDVIYVEYDPVERNLRFSKKKGENYFEMPIIEPPQNDAYHPFVGLCESNESVQLLLPPN